MLIVSKLSPNDLVNAFCRNRLGRGIFESSKLTECIASAAANDAAAQLVVFVYTAATPVPRILELVSVIVQCDTTLVALAAVNDPTSVWLVEPDDVMYVKPADPPAPESVGVVEAVAVTRPALVVVVAPVFDAVTAAVAVETAKVTPTEPVTAVDRSPLPLAVTVTVSPTVLSTRK